VERLQIVRDEWDGVVNEVSFAVRRNGQDVPAVLRRPRSSLPPPVVLLGHGGSGHKRNGRNVRLARWLAMNAGIASLAIDGPFHGDRAVAGNGPDYQQLVLQEGARQVQDRMLHDWLEVLHQADGSGWVNADQVAMIGMSMGARYGLPVCAALSGRLRCAVIGKCGLVQSRQLPAGLAVDDITVGAARTMTAPLMQHVQWHDEVFPLRGQLELFELLASPEKQMLVRPGAHATTHPDDEITWCGYVASHINQRPDLDAPASVRAQAALRLQQTTSRGGSQ